MDFFRDKLDRRMSEALEEIYTNNKPFYGNRVHGPTCLCSSRESCNLCHPEEYDSEDKINAKISRLEEERAYLEKIRSRLAKT